jgi:hypothetical protein
VSDLPGSLQLDAALRRDLDARFAERPWPPPAKSDRDELLARTARRVLHDLADEPPEHFPECADWILVVPEANAPAVRSEAIDSRLLVAGQAQWESLPGTVRGRAQESAAVLELDVAGESPATWAALLPPSAPSRDELVATLGLDAPAVSARLSAPGFGELLLLHAWSVGPDGPLHAPDLSGVLSIRPPLERDPT